MKRGGVGGGGGDDPEGGVDEMPAGGATGAGTACVGDADTGVAFVGAAGGGEPSRTQEDESDFPGDDVTDGSALMTAALAALRAALRGRDINFTQLR